jgi:hypothetical protein
MLNGALKTSAAQQCLITTNYQHCFLNSYFCKLSMINLAITVPFKHLLRMGFKKTSKIRKMEKKNTK